MLIYIPSLFFLYLILSWILCRTDIEWYPGKCLTQKILKKKPRKGSKNAKTITKTEDCESFFNFFSPPEVPEDDEDVDDEVVSFEVFSFQFDNETLAVILTKCRANCCLHNRQRSFRIKWNKTMTLGECMILAQKFPSFNNGHVCYSYFISSSNIIFISSYFSLRLVYFLCHFLCFVVIWLRLKAEL